MSFSEIIYQRATVIVKINRGDFISRSEDREITVKS
jgi:hypothetical protein